MNKTPILVQLGYPTHQNGRTTRAKSIKLLEIVKQQSTKSILIPQGYSADYEKFKLKMLKNKKTSLNNPF